MLSEGEGVVEKEEFFNAIMLYIWDLAIIYNILIEKWKKAPSIH